MAAFRIAAEVLYLAVAATVIVLVSGLLFLAVGRSAPVLIGCWFSLGCAAEAVHQRLAASFRRCVAGVDRAPQGRANHR